MLGPNGISHWALGIDHSSLGGSAGLGCGSDLAAEMDSGVMLASMPNNKWLMLNAQAIGSLLSDQSVKLPKR